MKVKELLSDENKWTKFSGARDLDNLETEPDDSDAVCWCLLGAVRKCYDYGYGYDFHDSKFLQVRTLVVNRIGGLSITNWNDAPERTFQEVKALVEELDI